MKRADRADWSSRAVLSVAISVMFLPSLYSSPQQDEGDFFFIEEENAVMPA